MLLFDHSLIAVAEKIKENETAVMARDRLLHLILALGGTEFLEIVEKKFYLFAVNSLHHSAVAVEGIRLERHLYNYIYEIVSRGVETRQIRSDYSTEATVRFVAHTIDGILTNFFLSGNLPDRETTEPLIGYLFDGIKS